MDYQEAQKRLLVAAELLSGSTTSRQKFEHVRTLIKGINPRIDKGLAKCSSALDDVEKFQSGEIIELTVKHLSEDSQEKKKRKKILLFFINYWKDLKSEVDRVAKELKESKGEGGQGKEDLPSRVGKILWNAKGPLGLVTVVAVGLVALNALAITVVIKNKGCEALVPSYAVSISLPGLVLPRDPIRNGEQAVAKLPPLTFTVDGTSDNSVKLMAYGINLTFNLGTSNVNLLLNNKSLIGKKTLVNLGDSQTHELIISCKK